MIEASIDTIEISADIGKGYPVKGDKGDNGYVHIAYANSTDGKDFTLAPESGKTYEYLGQYTDNTETASTEWSDYKWSWLTDEASRHAAETARSAAETARATAEESRDSAEKTRVTAESERVTAETARANAESARAAAEETRVANEDGRTDDEARRRDAENRRASTEQAREANETARAAAESKRETDSAAAVNAANAAATNAQSIADTIQTKLDAGEFKGDKGDKGDSGVSPTATVTQTDTGATVTVTDAAGTTTADLSNAPQIDDAAVNTTNPWSSKNIVDRLCSETTATGNPALLNDVVAGYPLDITASWEVQQEGEGTPSTTNIRPFVGRDSVTINANGNDTALALPETVYAGSVRTDGSVKKTWLLATCDGNTTYSNQYHEYDNDESVFFSFRLPGQEDGIDNRQIYCNVCPPMAAGQTTQASQRTEYEICANPVSKYSSCIYIRVKRSMIGAEDTSLTHDELVAKMKAWAQALSDAGTPLTVAYQTTKPETITTTPVTIPALANNTVTTDADALTVTARESPIKTIAKLADRISALEAAATNISEV